MCFFVQPNCTTNNSLTHGGFLMCNEIFCFTSRALLIYSEQMMILWVVVVCLWTDRNGEVEGTLQSISFSRSSFGPEATTENIRCPYIGIGNRMGGITEKITAEWIHRQVACTRGRVHMFLTNVPRPSKTWLRRWMEEVNDQLSVCCWF